MFTIGSIGIISLEFYRDQGGALCSFTPRTELVYESLCLLMNFEQGKKICDSKSAIQLLQPPEMREISRDRKSVV